MKRILTVIACLIAGVSYGTEAHIGEVGGKTAIATGTFTRPANTTAYASGQLVANSTTAGSVTYGTLAVSRYTDKSGMIRRVRLKKSGTSTTNAQFRVHFYKTAPTFSNGDGGAWLSTESDYLGAVDVTMDKVFTDAASGIGTSNTGSEINFVPNSGTTTIYWAVEARAPYTPSSAEIFTVSVEVMQD